MFDFSELLDAVVPVEVEYLGKTVVVNTYTAAQQRLRIEDREKLLTLAQDLDPVASRLREIEAEIEIAKETTPDRVKVLEAEGRPLIDKADRFQVNYHRLVIPLVVQSWTVDGEALTYQGEEVLPSNPERMPDTFILKVGNAIDSAWKGEEEIEKKESSTSSPPDSESALALTTSA